MEEMNAAAMAAGLEARRAYKREWARAHRDQIRAQQARYWARRAAQEAAEQQANKLELTDRKQ